MKTQRSSFTVLGNDGDAPDGPGEIQVLAALLWKRKWVIAAISLLGLAATLLLTLRQQKIYTAKASIIIDPKAPEILGSDFQEVVQMGAGQMWWNQEYYNTQINILKSAALAENTVVRNALHRNEDFSKSIASIASEEEAIKSATSLLRGVLAIAPEGEQNRIHYIKARHPNPKVAAFVANAHVDTYINYALNLLRTGTSSATKWLSDELDAARKTLDESETALYGFKKDNDILSGSLEDRQSLISSEIQRNTEALINARLNRLELSAKLARIRAAAKLPVLESPIFSLADNEVGAELRANYFEAQKGLAEIQLELGPRNPERLRHEQSVATLLKAIEGESTATLRAAEERFRIAASTEKLFSEELQKHRAKAFRLGEKSKKFKELARKEKDATENLDIMLGRLRSSDLTSRLKTVNIRRLDPAVAPSSPSSPRLFVNLATGLFLSMLLGLGIAFLLDRLDRSVKTTKELEEHTGAPLLGVIPSVTDLDGERDMLIWEKPTSRAAECCRSVQTNLLFMGAEKAFKTLLIASANPREGKSTAAMYMATTMAQSGQRVLLIDSDMRRPRLHQAFGLSRTKGLSNVSLGDIPWQEAVQKTSITNLSLLPAGPTPPNPVELLMTDRFQATLKQFSEHFDKVILDSPPVLAVTDAMVLSQHVDGVIFIVRARTTSRDDVSRAVKQLFDVNAPLAGAVLNDYDLDSGGGDYYYHYGYGEENLPGHTSGEKKRRAG